MKPAVAFLVCAAFCGCAAAGQGPQGPHGQRRAAGQVRPRLSLQPCPGADGELGAQCGTYEVYEDRAAKTGRKISLNVVVVPALSATPPADPVFWLHGGPGAAATQVAAAAKNDFLAGLRKQRDLVFVDQRGTGSSNPLMCDIGDDSADLPGFFGDLFPPAKLRECRARLERTANLALYTTPIAMDDLDEVRDALGYGKINLVAGSYGTVAAQVYMRQHPESVRAVFLLGVANTGIKQPLPFAAGAQHAIDRLFEDCAADKACGAAFPNLRVEFAEVMARFAKGSVTAELINLATKQKQPVSITRGNFVERLRLGLYTTATARFVPFIIHQAYQNDYLPFQALAMRSNVGALVARGMYMTVTCSESVPFITEQDIARETKGTFVGDYRVRSHIEACKEWPRGQIPPSYIEPVKSDAPVLMISGDLDASTPVWVGESALKYLPNGRQVKIRYYGHQADDRCIWKILDDFIDKANAAAIDVSCTERIRRPPFVTSQRDSPSLPE